MVQLWLDGPVLHASTFLATPGNSGITFPFGSDSELDVFPDTREIYPMDVDGDGRMDLLIAFQDPRDHSLNLAIYLSDGQGFNAAPGSPFNTGDPWDPATHLKFFAMDANGDGRTDFVEAYAQDGRLFLRTYLSLFGPSSSGFTPAIVSSTGDPANPPEVKAFWAMDVNGDGMMDITRVWRDSASNVHITSYVSVSTAIEQVSFTKSVNTNLGIFNFEDHAFLPVDVNGDGIQDLLHIWLATDGTTLNLTTMLCDAAAGFVEGPSASFQNQTVDLTQLYPMGLNGGGQVSIVCPWTNTNGDLNFTIFQASPSGVFRLLSSPPPVSVDPNSKFYPGDPDGNGKADLVQVFTDGNNIPQLVPFLSVGPYNDLVASVTNSLGGVISVQYAPLSDSSVYQASAAAFPNAAGRRYPTPLTPAQFPAQNVLGQATYVVQSFTKSNDSSANRFAYDFGSMITYAGAQVNLVGRGWQGFGTMRTTNLDSGKVIQQTFNQDFPLTATVAETRIEADGKYSSDPRVPEDQTVLMRIVSTTYGVFADSGAPQVLRTAFQTAEFDYGEQNFDYQLAQTFGYDAYGNVVREVNLGYVDRATNQPLYPDEVVYRYKSYQNDLFQQGWALGYLRYAKISSNSTDPDVTRFLPGDLQLKEKQYDAGTYNLTSQAQWDNANSVYLTSSYTYDSYGNRQTETSPGGFVTRYTYDPDFHTFKMTVTLPPDNQGLSLVTSYGYDPRFGQEVARCDPNGSIFIIALDGFGRKIAMQGPVPAGSSADTNQLTPLVTGSAQLKQQFLAATVVTTETTAHLCDGQGGIYTETQSLQKFPEEAMRDFVWKQSYVDGLSLEREMVRQTGQSAGNAVTIANYNSAGKPILQSLPFFSPTAIVSGAPHSILTIYDVLGRPISRQDPTGPDGNTMATSTWAYSLNGEVTVTAASGSNVAYTQIQNHHFYDSQDKVQQTVVPSDGNATSVFQFDRMARLLQATDPPTAANPNGVTNTTTYDSLNRVLTIDNPDQNTTGDPNRKAAKYEYDPVTGTLQRYTDAALQTIIYLYDSIGRQTGQNLSDGTTITLTYDEGDPQNRGHLTQVTLKSPNGAVQSQYVMRYDVYGNKSQLTTTVAGESFTVTSVFDPQKRPIQETLPDQSVIVRGFSFSQLVSLSLGDAQSAYPLEYYHPTGKAGRLIYGNGSVDGGCVVANYTFNPAGQMYHETVTNGSGNILDDAYRYDLLNQILSIGNSQSYTYVNQRLTEAITPGFAPAAYGYDASSNLLVKDGVAFEFHAHFAFRGTKDSAEAYSATPDACGRTIARTANGSAQTFEYDGLGFLRRVAASDGKTILEMLNDYRGRRLRQEDAVGNVTVYVSAGYEVSHSGGSSSVTKYLRDDYGPVAVIKDAIQYLRRDHKTSITHVFAQDGTLVSVIGYGGYGEFTLLSGSAEPQVTYENRYWDAAPGLFYFGARYYDPLTGRFLTPDDQASGTSLLQPGVLNRYAFELNNPIQHVDPTGHMPSWALGLIIGLTIVAVGILVVATAGTAAPIVGVLGATGASVFASVVGGALIAGGIGASSYAVANRSNFSWRDYGIHLGISAAVGAVSGGAFYGLGAATAGMTAGRALVTSILGSALISGAGDVLGQLATNAAEGDPLIAGLGSAALFGVVFGAAGGALGFGAGKLVEGAFARAAARGAVPAEIEMVENPGFRREEFQALLSSPAQRSYGTFAQEVEAAAPAATVLQQAHADAVLDTWQAKVFLNLVGAITAWPEAFVENETSF